MRFIDHYNQELRQLRGGAARFAAENPQVAAQLGLHADAVTDPFVERLLEGLSYLSARIHTRLDLECAEFAHQALNQLAPLFLRPTPSISVLAFQPDHQSPESTRQRVIPKGQLIDVTLPGRARPITLQTGRAVHMLPLRLEKAECARSLSGLPSRVAEHLSAAHAVIRLSFALEAPASARDLASASSDAKLSLSMAGDLPMAFSLHRALMADCLSGVLAVQDGDDIKTHAFDQRSKRCAALDDEQSLLPTESNAMPGLRLLREYFANPARFLSLELDVLKDLARLSPGARQFEIYFALHRTPPDLLGQVSARSFRLFATPVINLYPRRLDPVPMNTDKAEQWVVVDRMRPQAHQLWQVLSVHCAHSDGTSDEAVQATVSAPYFGKDAAARWSLRLLNNEAAGAAAGSADLDVVDHLALSYPQGSEALDKVTTVHIKGLVMDREWNTQDLMGAQYVMRESHALESVECLWPGSLARTSPQGQRCWEAAQLIALDPLRTTRAEQASVLTAVKRFIGLASDDRSAVDLQRIQGLSEVKIRRDFSRAGPSSPMAWVRSRSLDVHVASSAHPDQGAWLFGRVLADALHDYTPINDGFKVQIVIDGERVSQHSNLSRQDGRLA